MWDDSWEEEVPALWGHATGEKPGEQHGTVDKAARKKFTFEELHSWAYQRERLKSREAERNAVVILNDMTMWSKEAVGMEGLQAEVGLYNRIDSS